jgi:ATP-dependent DNA helicase PIF1
MDTGDPKIRDKLLANMMAPPVIELKVGAQVMLIKNMDETLVNGSLGTVVEFMSESSLGIRGVGDDSDVESDAKKRIRAFESALSEGSNPDNKLYPMVRFHAVDGSQRHLLCVPEDWKVELPTGEMQASRKQLPLILAWALSIHKAQGQTLERVKVDLGKVFEKGQAYVALSRATSQEGLQVLRFQKDKIMAHPRVVEFYNKLYSAEAAVKKKAAGSITSYATKVTKQEALPRKLAGQQEDVFDEDEEEAMAAYG